MLTKQEIEAQYDVSVDGIIVDFGKFENEPRFVPYFWDLVMDGGGDYADVVEDDDTTSVFVIDADDIAMFPELKGYSKIFIWETEQGFVCHDLR